MEKIKNFREMKVEIFNDPAENEAFLDWLILAVLFPLSMGLPPLCGGVKAKA
ncbi:MAG: hypothetical protein Q8O45_06320 [Desulfurivibrionaceae bacterium]|nr:hypothetical protein [Desulfurivibrionaceae bacterium]